MVWFLKRIVWAQFIFAVNCPLPLVQLISVLIKKSGFVGRCHVAKVEKTIMSPGSICRGDWWTLELAFKKKGRKDNYFWLFEWTKWTTPNFQFVFVENIPKRGDSIWKEKMSERHPRKSSLLLFFFFWVLVSFICEEERRRRNPLIMNS